MGSNLEKEMFCLVEKKIFLSSRAHLYILSEIIVKNHKRCINDVFCEEDGIVYNWKSFRGEQSFYLDLKILVEFW